MKLAYLEEWWKKQNFVNNIMVGKKKENFYIISRIIFFIQLSSVKIQTKK